MHEVHVASSQIIEKRDYPVSPKFKATTTISKMSTMPLMSRSARRSSIGGGGLPNCAATMTMSKMSTQLSELMSVIHQAEG